MGFFSWKTKDTNKVIYNIYSEFYYSDNSARVIYLVNPTTKEVYKEDRYVGYGEFGRKDYFILMAELNGLHHDDFDRMRKLGIDLCDVGYGRCNNEQFLNWNKEIIYPVLIENLENLDKALNTNEKPQEHCGQGYWE